MLRLDALDAEDLAVISAHMQDAVLKAGDLSYLRKARKFALVANRFVREHGPRPEHFERRRAGLHFERVNKVMAQNIRRDDGQAVLSLLSIGFEEGEAPSGAIVLDFSAGGSIRLEVECIEARLSDLGPAWAAAHMPQHQV
ncbi:MAG: DUF2948 family protein [Hyphomicrobiales bacterium]